MAREDKTRSVDRAHAETRLSDARAFLQQAEISLQLVDGPRRSATVVSSAVLAGIAACDAACALALGLVSAGAHDQAVRLLTRVSGSSKAVGDLSKLVSIKTAAQYTGKVMAERQATDAIRRAQRLVAFAESQRRG
jgi:hypothetical protein